MYVIRAKYFDRRKRTTVQQNFTGATQWEARDRQAEWEEKNRDAKLENEDHQRNLKRQR